MSQANIDHARLINVDGIPETVGSVLGDYSQAIAHQSTADDSESAAKLQRQERYSHDSDNDDGDVTDNGHATPTTNTPVATFKLTVQEISSSKVKTHFEVQKVSLAVGTVCDTPEGFLLLLNAADSAVKIQTEQFTNELKALQDERSKLEAELSAAEQEYTALRHNRNNLFEARSNNANTNDLAGTIRSLRASISTKEKLLDTNRNSLQVCADAAKALPTFQARTLHSLFARFNVDCKAIQPNTSRIEVRFPLIEFSCLSLGVGQQTNTFIDIGHLTSVAVIGENGSGKTTLGSMLRCAFNATFDISLIGANRLLSEPDFKILVERICQNHGTNRDNSVWSKNMKDLWHDAFPQREIIFTPKKFETTMEIRRQKRHYAPAHLSDGEKGILGMLFHVFLVPDNAASSFRIIIVDEPEAHLHPALVETFWLKIERSMPKAFFIYLTHDIVFAGARRHPFRRCLEIHDVGRRSDFDDIQLTLVGNGPVPIGVAGRLYGARHANVLFIEGDESHSADAQVYASALRDWIVIPCGSCSVVKTCVKAFGMAPFEAASNLPLQRVFGLVDGDYTDGSMPEATNVLVSPLAIVENLYVVPEFLDLLYGTRLDNEGEKIRQKALLAASAEIAVSSQVEQYDRYWNIRGGGPLSGRANTDKLNFFRLVGSDKERYAKLLQFWKTKNRRRSDGANDFDWSAVLGEEFWQSHCLRLIRMILYDENSGKYITIVKKYLPKGLQAILELPATDSTRSALVNSQTTQVTTATSSPIASSISVPSSVSAALSGVAEDRVETYVESLENEIRGLKTQNARLNQDLQVKQAQLDDLTAKLPNPPSPFD